MKTTFENTDQIKGAIKYARLDYEINVSSIDAEKDLHFVVLDLGHKWKIEASWIIEIQSDGVEATPKSENDYFYLLKGKEDHKLPGCLNDVFDKVVKNEVVKITTGVVEGDVVRKAG